MDRSWCVYKLVRFYHSLHLRKLVAKAGRSFSNCYGIHLFTFSSCRVFSVISDRFFFTLSKNLSVFCYIKAGIGSSSLLINIILQDNTET
jgi:hypothetical protein